MTFPFQPPQQPRNLEAWQKRSRKLHRRERISSAAFGTFFGFVALVSIGITIAVVFVAYHFISKYW